jgi:hypothetical protein
VDPPEDARPPLASLFAVRSIYWYDNYWKPLISASGGSAFSDEKITVSIPRTYKGIAPIVIEYVPYYYSKSEISEALYKQDVYCMPVVDYDPIRRKCYNYQCMREETVTTLYESGTVYTEELIVSLEDGAKSYVPTVRGAITFDTPTVKPPDNRWYLSVVRNIYFGGGHIDKSEGRVPHIVVNPRYEFVTAMM